MKGGQEREVRGRGNKADNFKEALTLTLWRISVETSKEGEVKLGELREVKEGKKQGRIHGCPNRVRVDRGRYHP